MPDDELVLDAELVKVLASDTRLDLLALLGKRRMTLSEMARAVKLSKATVLEHLEKLLATQLVRRRDDHRLWVYYELTRKGTRLLQADTPVRLQLAREPPVAHLPPLGPALAVGAVALVAITALMVLPALQPNTEAPQASGGPPPFAPLGTAPLDTRAGGWDGPAFQLLSLQGGMAASDARYFAGAYATSPHTNTSSEAPAPTTGASGSPAPSSPPPSSAEQDSASLVAAHGTLWTSFLVEPVMPTAGDTVTFDVLVLNPTNASAARAIALVVDGNTTVQRWFELNASETSHLIVRGVFGPGAHTVRVDDTERAMWVAERPA